MKIAREYRQHNVTTLHVRDEEAFRHAARQPEPKDSSFTLRIDPSLKAAFVAATEAKDKLAAQAVRDFMRSFVNLRK